MKLSQFSVTLLLSLVCLAPRASISIVQPTVTPSVKNKTPIKQQATKNSVKKTSRHVKTRLWNLQNADIKSVINEIAQETGKNFIVAPNVKGSVTIVSGHAIDAREAYQLFLAALNVSGFAAIPSGHAIKILPNNSARQQGIPLQSQSSGASSDAMIARVVSLHNISASQITPIIRPLMPSTGLITAYQPSNTLIVAGHGDSVNRLLSIIHRVDTADTDSIEIFPLHNATAAQVVSTLNNLQSAERARGSMPHLSISADDRSNSVLLSGDKQARLKIRVLLSQLDTQSKNGTDGNTAVIYLHYLKAKDVVPVLASVAKSAYGVSVGTAIGTLDTEQEFPKNTRDEDGDKSSDATNAMIYKATAPAGASQHASVTESTSSNGKVGKGNKIEIAAEPNTNAVVIAAPPSLMRTLKSVIAHLDIRPAQVLVEAVIAEVSDARLRNLGVEWGTDGKSNFANTAFEPNFPLSGGLGLGFIRAGSLRVLINALARDRSSNILSTPSIVVLDNKMAQINVGQIVPFTNTQISVGDNGSTAQPYINTQRKEVGLHLYVTPQINQGDAVQLKIDQGNETLGEPLRKDADPVTNNSKVKTTVLVENGAILVLGGLTSNKWVETTQKVPLLGDIPLLGRLFQSKVRSQEKENLMIFLKPVILHNAHQSLTVSNQRYNYMRDRQLLRNDDMNPNLSRTITPMMNPLHLPSGTSLPAPFTDPFRG